ncbi:unnamed protein product [Symbiodinium sp. KB8]|nr:unnamed protein product [Symbiodinium sp. KB8]
MVLPAEVPSCASGFQRRLAACIALLAPSIFDEEGADSDSSGLDGGGSDAGSSIASFDDGYDSDLMGDDDDREMLEQMQEMDREALLAQRHDERERGRELVQVRRQQQEMRRRREQAQAGAAGSKGRKLRRAGDARGAAKPAGGKGKKLRQGTRRSRRSRHGDDDDDDDDDEEGAGEEEEEEDDDEMSSDEELPEFAAGVREADDDDDEDSDFEGAAAGGARGGGKAKGKRAGRPAPSTADIWGDDEDLYGGAEDEAAFDDDERDSGGGLMAGAAVEVSDAVMARLEAEAGEEQREALTLSVVNGCRAKRDFIAASFHEPWFKRAVCGLPVRVYLGTTSTGAERYRLGRIAEVVRFGKPYTLTLPQADAGAVATSRAGAARVKTDRCLLVYVAHKDEGKPFPISRVSNGRVTSSELVEYLSHLRGQSREAPRPAWLRRKAEQVRKLATEHEYTPAEVEALLAQRREAVDPAAVRNIAILRSDTQRRVDVVQAQLYQKLSALATDKTQVRLPATPRDSAAALKRALAAIADEDKAAAAAAVAAAEKETARLSTMLATIDRETARRQREVSERDAAALRSTKLNSFVSKRNADRRLAGVRRAKEGRRSQQQRVAARAAELVKLTGMDYEDAMRQARTEAQDPIKRREAIAEPIWKVKSAAEAEQDRLGREEKRLAELQGKGKASAAEEAEPKAAEPKAAAPEAEAEAKAEAAPAPAAATSEADKLLAASTGSARRTKGLDGAAAKLDADAVLRSIIGDRADAGAAGAAGTAAASGASAAGAASGGGKLSLSEVLRRRRLAKAKA